MNYFFAFLLSFFLGLGFTWFAIKFSKKIKLVDIPNQERKIHKKATPLLGGVAVFLASVLVLFFFKEQLVIGNLTYHHWLGVLIGGIFLLVGGILDDYYDLAPQYQIIWPIMAVLSVIAGGVGIEKITNPLGGYFYLDQIKFPILTWTGQTHYFVLLSDLFVMVWIMGMTYTTKLLDGLDGLVGGVSAIGSLIIFLFTITTKYYQPDIAFAALVFAGACLGFLVFNWHPAKIFLGSTGSLLTGFFLGVLSVISGGKIAIALLIMGIPILDVFWIIIRRLLAKQNPFRHADRKHLHFRLLDSGLSTRQTVIIYYLLSLLFGLTALFLQSLGKLYSLSILLVIMLIVIFFFSKLDKKTKTN